MNINPYEIYEKDSTNKLGVIIDCKYTETPSQFEDLEYDLARFSTEILKYRNFKNIVFFRDRDDFELVVNELKVLGVERILYILAGATVDKTAYESVIAAPHLSASMTSSKRVLRKFFIFDVNKYQYYQLKEDFLDNIKDQITSIDSEDIGISYLNPDETNYKFLEKLVDYKIPEITDLNLQSPGDVEHGDRIIRDTEEFLLNT